MSQPEPTFDIDLTRDGIQNFRSGLRRLWTDINKLKSANNSNTLTPEEFDLLRDAKVFYEPMAGMTDEEIDAIVRPQK